MVTHTTNPTHIIEIPRSAISLQVARNASGELESIRIENIDTSALKTLPPDSRLWLIAKVRFTEIEVDLGTIAELRVPRDVPLGTLDRTRPLHLRAFVFDSLSKRILASCERLSTYDAEEGSLQSLLPVEPLDLGELAWRVQAENDERPILQVSSDMTLGMLDRLRNDPVTQALVLPAALEQVFRHLQACGAEDGAEEWMKRWVRFLDQIGCPLPEEDEDERDPEWPKTATQAACRHLKLRSRAVKFLESESQ